MSSPYDLVSLADLKTWLDLASTDDDALLGRLITQVSRATLGFLDRGNILPARIVETRDGRNDTEIVLRQWPVASITALSIDGAAIAPAPPLVAGNPHRSGYLLEATEPAPPGHMQRLALRGHLFTAGVQNIRVTYMAGYQVLAEPAVVPATAPYEVLPQEPYGDWASDCGVVHAHGTPLTAVASAPGRGNMRSPMAFTHSRWRMPALESCSITAMCRLIFASPRWIGSQSFTIIAAVSASSRNRSAARKRRRSSSRTCRISSRAPCSPIAG